MSLNEPINGQVSSDTVHYNSMEFEWITVGHVTNSWVVDTLKHLDRKLEPKAAPGSDISRYKSESVVKGLLFGGFFHGGCNVAERQQNNIYLAALHTRPSGKW
ncbi:hypothetical protein DASC09_035470 [Saccharomycopsis crataegensis]|uniref:Uncharacterized protein n=1 Tax=Saccharomycopsis crataegensis TaxID=43959 RepID=A0AAV5QN36_9ASCO|nr:hypothetical protein DASC09_035470 [Saccharomycopsis crataegensis]